jgi:transposase-like protein
MIYNKNIILEVFNMPRYKLSPEERAAEKERKENLRNIMKGLDVKSFDDLKDVFKLMVGEMLENGLEGELDDELGYTKYDYRNKDGENSRNGYSKKTLKTSFGETEIKVPRDRDGEFEPQLVKKNQTTLTVDIEEKILSMYAKGMTTSDIETHIQDIYGLECCSQGMAVKTA